MQLLFHLLVGSCFGLSIILDPESKESFFENLETGQKFGLQYRVDGDSNHNIRVLLKGPSGKRHYLSENEDYGTFSFQAEEKGKHIYSFEHPGLSPTSRKIVFTLSGLNYRDDILEPKPEDKDLIDKELQQEIQLLNRQLRRLKHACQETQNLSKENNALGRNVNSNMFWWSIGEILVIIGMCAWQIYYLKQFFEVKRNV